MAGKTDFIVNGSFERQAGGDATAWIDAAPQLDPGGDGHTYQFRGTVDANGPPDGWAVTRGFFGLETQVAPAARSTWDGKVWGLAHDGTIAQSVTGLTAGTVYDLAFVAYHPEWPVPSDVQVFWNGQQVADFGTLTADPGHMAHVLVTAGAGANQLELRTTSVVVIDDVRLFAAGPGQLIDFSQTTQPLGVNLGDVVFRSQFAGTATLPVLPALHAYPDGTAMPVNGVTSVIGGPMNDLLVAATQGGGTLEGRAGDDAIVGGAGDDTLMGGAGNDLIVGGDGRNYLRGDDGSDSVQGGSGFDDINGNKGDDAIDGGSGGDDWLVGGQGNDLITAHASGNILYGNLGSDTLNGGTGAEILRGGQGDDSVTGGLGDDFVSGDRGNDTISGGGGADLFHGSQDAGIDRVLDFHVSEGDRVLLDPGTTYALLQVGADTVLDMGGGNQMILVGVDKSTLPPGWVLGA